MATTKQIEAAASIRDKLVAEAQKTVDRGDNNQREIER